MISRVVIGPVTADEGHHNGRIHLDDTVAPPPVQMK